jgi:hypothetical protein
VQHISALITSLHQALIKICKEKISLIKTCCRFVFFFSHTFISAQQQFVTEDETRTLNIKTVFLISNFRRVLNVACFILGNSLASEFDMPMFHNNQSVPSP